MLRDTEEELTSEERLLASVENKLLREEFRRAVRHAGAADPQVIVDQFLQDAEFVCGRIMVNVGSDKLTVRELIARTRDENS